MFLVHAHPSEKPAEWDFASSVLFAGFAPIGGMCNQIRSCTINEDTGLNTALTIAHEVGHKYVIVCCCTYRQGPVFVTLYFLS